MRFKKMKLELEKEVLADIIINGNVIYFFVNKDLTNDEYKFALYYLSLLCKYNYGLCKTIYKSEFSIKLLNYFINKNSKNFVSNL